MYNVLPLLKRLVLLTLLVTRVGVQIRENFIFLSFVKGNSLIIIEEFDHGSD